MKQTSCEQLVIPGAEPARVWDLFVTRDVRFHDLVSHRFVEDQKAKGAAPEQIRRSLTSNVLQAADQLWRSRPFDALYLTGGLTHQLDIDHLPPEPTRPFEVFVDPMAENYAGEAALALGLGDNLAVADFGQTSIKVFHHLRTPILTMPGSNMHVYGQVKVAQVILDFLDEIVKPEAPIVVSLSAPVSTEDGEIKVGESTLNFPPMFARRLVTPGRRIYVVNDAALATKRAEVEVPQDHRTILVLTLGFGPGAAFLRRPV